MRKILFALASLFRRVLAPLGIERVGFLRLIYRYFKKRLKSNRAHIDGFELVLDPGDSLDLSIDPDYESFEREFLASIVREGETVVDVGANVGFFTLFFARWVGPEGKVFAFEPDPVNFSLLQTNVGANGLSDRVALENRAVSNRAEETSLFLSESNAGDHRLYDSGDGRSRTSVRAVRLDEYFETVGATPSFVKMDIQGAETLALEGMRTGLERWRDLRMFIEFWPAGLRRCGSSSESLIQTLVDGGFLVHHVDDEGREVREMSDPFELLSRFPETEERHTNLYCSREPCSYRS